MAKKTVGYSEAIKEVEQILEQFDSEEFDVDRLAEQVKRATQLIKECKESLHKAQIEVDKVLKEE